MAEGLGMEGISRTESTAPIQESDAHAILLSLSKSFERGDAPGDALSQSEVTTKARGGRKAEEGQPQRPPSPHGPPAIQHWHKQSSRSFEVRLLRSLCVCLGNGMFWLYCSRWASGASMAFADHLRLRC